MQNKKIRIVYIVDNLKISNGISTVIMNYFRNIDKSAFSIDFLVIGIENDDKDTYKAEINLLNGNIFYSNIEYSIKNIFKIKKFVKSFFTDNKYDIIELHLTSLAYLILNKSNFKNNEIRILHTHSSIKSTNRFKNYINSFLNYNIKKYAEYYFGCSIDSGRYWFGDKVVESNKFSFIANGTSIDKYAYDINKRKKLREQFDIDKKTLAIGFVGRISKDKNLHFIINVIKKMQGNDVKLFLVGSPSNDYKNIMKCINNENNIKYLGFRNDTNDLYNMFDCLVLCSKKEGLPMVVVEAQLNSLPCIVSNTITKEVDIGLCKYLPLKEYVWCNELKNVQINDERECTFNANKFDIIKNVNDLEKIYKRIVEIGS